MKVAVLVLTWNAAAVALECLKTVANQERQPDYILVVDNASTDKTAESIKHAFPNFLLKCHQRNLGFSAGMNSGIETLQALPEPPDLVVLLNQDTLLEPQWLQEIIAPFEDGFRVGAVGCKIRFRDGTIQHAGAYLEWPRAVAHHVGWHERDTGQYNQRCEYNLVTGAAIALKMQALNEIGLFDPGYSPAYYEDADLCWRLRHKNYRIVYAPKAVLTHYESLSIRDEFTRSCYYNRGRLRFVLKTFEYKDILGTFAESERAFIRQHGRGIETRALRWAYLETFKQLPEILQARSHFYPLLTPEETSQIKQMLLTFKQTITQTLYGYAKTTIDKFLFL